MRAGLYWKGTTREVSREVGYKSPGASRRRGHPFWLNQLSQHAHLVFDVCLPDKVDSSRMLDLPETQRSFHGLVRVHPLQILKLFLKKNRIIGGFLIHDQMMAVELAAFSLVSPAAVLIADNSICKCF